MARILLIEDSTDIRDMVCAVLGSENNQVLWASNLTDGSQKLEDNESPFDLILLDIDLPDGNGIEFLSSMQKHLNERGTGTILLTGTNTVDTRTQSFMLGALDYIPKPFDVREFQVRVNAKIHNLSKLAHASETKAPALRCGLIELDPLKQQAFILSASGSLSGDREQIDLTPVEFRLLLLFLQTTAVSRDQILETVWGQATHVSARCVDHHICSLRKKIAKTGAKISSIYGVGYRLVA